MFDSVRDEGGTVLCSRPPVVEGAHYKCPTEEAMRDVLLVVLPSLAAVGTVLFGRRFYDAHTQGRRDKARLYLTLFIAGIESTLFLMLMFVVLD